MVLIKGEGWKELKLGIVFKDSMILNKNKPRHIIAEKEYTTYLGSAEEFKKMLWTAAVKNGCGRVKEIVIIGDGAAWIWNIAGELFQKPSLSLIFITSVNMLMIVPMQFMVMMQEIKRNGLIPL